MRKKLISAVLAGMTLCSFLGCGGQSQEAQTTDSGSADNKLVIYCPGSEELVNPVINEFEKQTGIKTEVIAAGTGELLKRVESENGNPLGDVLWTGTVSTIAPQADLFEEYQSANEADVQEDLKNKEGALTRFTEIPSVLMINKDLVGDIKIEGYEDLLNPELKGKIAFADPSKSSSAFEHLVNMLYDMGNGNPEDGWSYVEKFAQNLDGKVLNGSSAVTKGVADGEYAVGLSNEPDAAKYVKDGAPVEIIYMKEGVISKPDGIYIIKNAVHMDNAKKFVDFVTSKEAQTIVVEKSYRRSVRKDVEQPANLKSKDEINVVKDDDKVVSNSKQKWLTKFQDIFTSL